MAHKFRQYFYGTATGLSKLYVSFSLLFSLCAMSFAKKWHILSELSSCKHLSNLVQFTSSDARVINRNYPFRPFPIASEEGSLHLIVSRCSVLYNIMRKNESFICLLNTPVKKVLS